MPYTSIVAVRSRVPLFRLFFFRSRVRSHLFPVLKYCRGRFEFIRGRPADFNGKTLQKNVTAEPAEQRLGSAPAPVRCTPQGTSAPSVHWYARFRWTEMRLAASLAMDRKTAPIAKFALVQHPPRVPTQKERKTSNLRVSKNPLANVRKRAGFRRERVQDAMSAQGSRKRGGPGTSCCP